MRAKAGVLTSAPASDRRLEVAEQDAIPSVATISAAKNPRSQWAAKDCLMPRHAGATTALSPGQGIGHLALE